jgi:folate-binding protein YgfZ
MVDHGTLRVDVEALHAGGAWVDLSDRRTIRVGGADAIGWLHDLLTADVAGLERGEARRSLLLTPTGYIRADVHVVRRDDDVVLIQDPSQPEDILAALGPYVLSADVVLEDRSGHLAIFALPGCDAAPDGLPGFAVSSLGAGIDVIVPVSRAHATRLALASTGANEVGAEAAEAWRIAHGVARMGPDFDRRTLPAEAALVEVIDTTKGCFLGQESVARIRNLGHPPRVLRHMQSQGALLAGTAVRDGGSEVGEVTSATWIDGRSIALVRIAWSAATTRLTDSDGHPLRDVESPG